nr:unnamed protein product [Digitaria exilis]
MEQARRTIAASFPECCRRVRVRCSSIGKGAHRSSVPYRLSELRSMPMHRDPTKHASFSIPSRSPSSSLLLLAGSAVAVSGRIRRHRTWPDRPSPWRGAAPLGGIRDGPPGERRPPCADPPVALPGSRLPGLIRRPALHPAVCLAASRLCPFSLSIDALR